MNLKPDKEGTKIGLIAGFISSLCCITPAAILLMGLGGTSFALSFVGLKPYFLIVSILFLLAALWWNKRKKQCDLKTSLRSSFTLSAVLVHFIIFVFAFYLLVPYISSTMINQKETKRATTASESCSISIQLKDKLGCSTCSATLEKYLVAIKGVNTVKLDSKKAKVQITYDQKKAKSKTILGAFPENLQIQDQKTSC